MKKFIITLTAITLTAMTLTSCAGPRQPQIYCRMDSVCGKASANACSKNGGVEDGACATAEIFEKPQAAEGAEWFTDSRDGKSYRTVAIGDQIWMAENLNIKTENSVCNENKPENCDKYGRLYNWPDAMQACPSGWHLPTDDEWAALGKAVGGSEEILLGIVVGYSIAGTALKSKSGWSHNKDLFFNEMIIFGNGTDTFGFSALPGGYLSVPMVDYIPGRGEVQTGTFAFTNPNSFGRWWSANEHPNDAQRKFANCREILSGDEKVHWTSALRGSGLSVRCVKDMP